MNTLADALLAARFTPATTTAAAPRAAGLARRVRRVAAIAVISVAGAFAGAAAGQSTSAARPAVDEDALYSGIHVAYVPATDAEIAAAEAESPAIRVVAAR